MRCLIKINIFLFRRVLIIGAYSSNNITAKYYGNDTDPGAHLPFNFGLIDKLNDESTAANFNDAVYSWLDNIPLGIWPNWVVNEAYNILWSTTTAEYMGGLKLLQNMVHCTAERLGAVRWVSHSK